MSDMIPLEFTRHTESVMQQRAEDIYDELNQRRSVRHFSSEPVPAGVLETCIHAAGTSPSGAHRQPWTFCVITNPELKRKIREAAEREERLLYEERITDEWREALRPMDTNAEKPFLETAPTLIVVMRQVYSLTEEEERQTNYYTLESIGIATGLLLAALHHAGLATLTHTPSPMGFLSEILKRPEHERAFLLVPVGYPADDCVVPNFARKPLEQILVRYD